MGEHVCNIDSLELQSDNTYQCPVCGATYPLEEVETARGQR